MARTNQSASRIVDALVELLHEFCYEEISISDITKKAGVSRITFYRNFRSREEVMLTFISQVTDQVQAAVGKENTEFRLQPYIETVLETILPYAYVVDRLYEAHLGELVQSFFDRYLLTTPVNSGLLDISEYERCFLAGGVYTVMLMWIRGGAKESAQEIAALCSRMIDQKEMQL